MNETGATPRMRATASRRRASSKRGLTLIELVVVVAVIGLMAGLALVSVQSLSHSQLRSSSIAIAGAIKESYDRSIMEKRIQRMVFNLDDHVWWVEFTEDPYALRASDGDDDDDEDELDFDDETPEEVKRALRGSRAATFTPDPRFGKKSPLPGTIHFGRAWTGMREKPFEDGTVYLHFFRGGFTEPLQLELYDGSPDSRPDEREYTTLKVRPLTGRVKIYPKRLSEPENDLRPWEEED